MRHLQSEEKVWEKLLKNGYETYLNNCAQNVFTPFELVNEMLGKIPKLNDMDNILVLNIEFAFILIKTFDISPNKITVWVESEHKLVLCSKLGIHKFIQGNFLDQKHIYNYNLRKVEDMKKFDVIVGNPPYNVGLLKRKEVSICNTQDEIVNAAAKTRIDAAFIVHSYENLLKDNGYLIFVWPYVWTQLSSWGNFREWIKKSGLVKIIASPRFEEVLTSTAITIQQKKYLGDSYYDNEYRNSNIKINWNYDIIPNCYSDIGYDIFERAMKYNNKIDLIKFNKVKEDDIFVMFNSASGDGSNKKVGGIDKIWGHISKLKGRAKTIIAGQLRSEEYILRAPDYNFCLLFSTINEKENFEMFFYGKLFNFLFHQIKADFHNGKSNLGIMPNLTKNMIGDYTDEKVYTELGLNQEQIDFIENIL